MRTSRGFAAVAVITLGLGIGANTAVFSVAKAVLLRPLGFEAPDRLMRVRSSDTRTGAVEERLSWREIEDIRESAPGFEALAAFGAREVTWDRGDRWEEVPALAVTSHLADVLRIRPVLGRALLPSDADEGAAPVLLIGHELWRARFGGAPDVIGQVVRLDRKVYTIVGVLPPGLQFPLQRAPAAGTGSTVTPGTQAFGLPLAVHRDDRVSRNARMFLTLGRLMPHVTPEAASAELATLGHRLAADHPETSRERRFDLVSLRDQVLGRTRQAISMLAAAVASVLMICCVNLANLLLARGLMRQRELALRAALGASRGRLVQAFMVETMILALLGGAFGLVVAEGALRAVRVLATDDVPFVREAAIDGAALVFTIVISIVTAFAFGLLPAFGQSGVDATDSPRGGARATSGPKTRSWQRRLPVGQMAVVLVLLMSAGLMLESFRRLIDQDLGYAPQSLVFAGRAAVGGRLILGDKVDRVLEVIGVVKDTRDVRLDERPKPRFYLHYAFGGAQVLVRCNGGIPGHTLLRCCGTPCREMTRASSSARSSR